MSSPVISRRWSEEVWSVATRSLAVVFPVVSVVLVAIVWLVSQVVVPVRDDVTRNFSTSVLIACGITIAASLLTGVALIARGSASTRGVGVSAAVSGIIVVMVGVANVVWIY